MESPLNWLFQNIHQGSLPIPCRWSLSIPPKNIKKHRKIPMAYNGLKSVNFKRALEVYLGLCQTAVIQINVVNFFRKLTSSQMLHRALYAPFKNKFVVTFYQLSLAIVNILQWVMTPFQFMKCRELVF